MLLSGMGVPSGRFFVFFEIELVIFKKLCHDSPSCVLFLLLSESAICNLFVLITKLLFLFPKIQKFNLKIAVMEMEYALSSKGG